MNILLVQENWSQITDHKEILKKEMEQAASLEVPLEIDMHTGENWYEAK